MLVFSLGLGLAAGLVAVSCGSEKEASRPVAPPPPTDTATVPVGHDEEPPPPPPGGRKVLAFRDGQARPMTENEARPQGLTVIDLSNFWTPFIFSEQDGPDGPRQKNDFRAIFRKLANDWPYESRTEAAAREIVDRHAARARAARIAALEAEGLTAEQIRERLGDGGTPDAGSADASVDGGAEEGLVLGGPGDAGHYLEVYGIPPSLSVLRRRAIEELSRPCLADVDFERIRRFDGFLSYSSNESARADAEVGRNAARRVRAALEAQGLTDPRVLLDKPTNKLPPSTVKAAIRYEALVEAQEQLACEGFYTGKGTRRLDGGIDWKTHEALSAFERKNRIFGWGYFGKETLAALGRTPVERLHDAFVRVLEERVASATGIIEDGSAEGPDGEPATYVDAQGTKVPVPNLVAGFTAAAMKHLGLDTPEKVRDFLIARTDAELDTFFVAVPLPPLPPYHGPDMDLHAVIDRGDIWYDFPFTADGRERVMPRRVMPSLTLKVRWQGQEIPLVKMGSTVGGWRTELAPDGYEYYKYKGSDVGPRVWRDVVAGPVWLPPDTTPMTDMVKTVNYKGHDVKVPNYDEFGPWYASAYGLVAAFHVRPIERKGQIVDWYDNGIRTHGSVDYMSILRRHSHGCHRLYNHLAIRLFDFVLSHRPFKRVGQVPAVFSKKFKVEEDEYTINLDTKGYRYELVTPVPVDVLTGNIRGKQKTPIETYMPKPGEPYGPDARFLPPGYLTPGADAGTDAGTR